MQKFDFIEKMTAHVAWPFTILLIALLFRNQIVLLITKLKKAKVAGNEFDFGREIDEFVDETKDAGLSFPTTNVRELKPEDAQLWVLREFAEIEDIVGKWFEQHWENYRQRMDLKRTKRPVSFLARLNILDRQQILDSDTVFLIQNLRRLRNHAAHTSDFELLAGEAFDFLAATEGLKSRIRDALDNAFNRET